MRAVILFSLCFIVGISLDGSPASLAVMVVTVSVLVMLGSVDTSLNVVDVDSSVSVMSVVIVNVSVLVKLGSLVISLYVVDVGSTVSVVVPTVSV